MPTLLLLQGSWLSQREMAPSQALSARVIQPTVGWRGGVWFVGKDLLGRSAPCLQPLYPAHLHSTRGESCHLVSIGCRPGIHTWGETPLESDGSYLNIAKSSGLKGSVGRAGEVNLRPFKTLLQRAEKDRLGGGVAHWRQRSIKCRRRCWQKSVRGQGGLLFSFASVPIRPTVPIYSTSTGCPGMS